jgi:hypothetical protein
MTPNKIEQEASPALQTAATLPSPPPQDVEDFRAVLSGVSCKVEDLSVEHQHDHKASPEHQTDLDERPTSEDEPERPGLPREDRALPSLLSQGLTRDKTPPPPRSQPTSVTPRQRRQRMGPHQERRDAMEPLAQLIATLRTRQSEQVMQLSIVPPSPNTLRLALQVDADERNFVVKARTSLPPEQRDDVKQALNVLERMLKQRLPESVAVTITLLA